MNSNIISVIVPYTSDHGIREESWRWIKKRYEILLPGCEICIGEYKIEPYCKAAAINAAVKKSTRPVLVIADADIFMDSNLIEQGLMLLEKFIMVIPYKEVIKFTPGLSYKICHSPSRLILEDFMAHNNLSRCTTYTNGVGGINILRRETFIQSGGFDERFKGWGYEDNGFNKLIRGIYGEAKLRRLEGIIGHLFHPQTNLFNNNYINNKTLLERHYNSHYEIMKTQQYLLEHNRLS